MTDDPRTELDDDELDEQEAEALPDREEMSVIDLGEGGGLAPPVFDSGPDGPPEVESPPPD